MSFLFVDNVAILRNVRSDGYNIIFPIGKQWYIYFTAEILYQFSYEFIVQKKNFGSPLTSVYEVNI